jgi:hypothetical protein
MNEDKPQNEREYDDLHIALMIGLDACLLVILGLVITLIYFIFK